MRRSLRRFNALNKRTNKVGQKECEAEQEEIDLWKNWMGLNGKYSLVIRLIGEKSPYRLNLRASQDNCWYASAGCRSQLGHAAEYEIPGR